MKTCPWTQRQTCDDEELHAGDFCFPSRTLVQEFWNNGNSFERAGPVRRGSIIGEERRGVGRTRKGRGVDVVNMTLAYSDLPCG